MPISNRKSAMRTMSTLCMHPTPLKVSSARPCVHIFSSIFAKAQKCPIAVCLSYCHSLHCLHLFLSCHHLSFNNLEVLRRRHETSRLLATQAHPFPSFPFVGLLAGNSYDKSRRSFVSSACAAGATNRSIGTVWTKNALSAAFAHRLCSH